MIPVEVVCGVCGGTVRVNRTGRLSGRLRRHTVDGYGTSQCVGAGRPWWSTHTIRWRPDRHGILRAVS